jgi:hypothetical protein
MLGIVEYPPGRPAFHCVPAWSLSFSSVNWITLAAFPACGA